MMIAVLATLTGCGGGGDNNNSSPKTLLSISVTPTNPSIAKDTSQQFAATGTFSDNSTQDLTTTVTWSSSDATRATISNAAGTIGKAAALAAGTTTIKATSGLISGSTVLTVTPATLKSIAVTPTNPVIAKATSQQFTATGTFSDNSTQDLTTAVTWSSSDATRATISNAAGTNGKATALAAGTTTIMATSGAISGSTALTVTPATLLSIAVTPANPSIVSSTVQQFTATGTFSDGSTQDLTTAVTWGSSDTTRATISNVTGTNGKAISLAAGTTIISATSGSISGSAVLTITKATLQSIAIIPLNPSIAKATSMQFTAVGTFSDNSSQDLTTTVTWSSSDTTRAAISNAAGTNGTATSLAAGTTTITATSGLISGSTTLTVTPATLQSIAVTPANPSIAIGKFQQFTATGTYSDNSTQDLTTAVTWSSSDTAMATISNAAGTNGKATALAAGTTTIMATSGAISGSTVLTVLPPPKTGTFAAVDSLVTPTLGLLLNATPNLLGNGSNVTGVAASTSGATWSIVGTMAIDGTLNATGTGTGATPPANMTITGTMTVPTQITSSASFTLNNVAKQVPVVFEKAVAPLVTGKFGLPNDAGVPPVAGDMVHVGADMTVNADGTISAHVVRGQVTGIVALAAIYSSHFAVLSGVVSSTGNIIVIGGTPGAGEALNLNGKALTNPSPVTIFTGSLNTVAGTASIKMMATDLNAGTPAATTLGFAKTANPLVGVYQGTHTDTAPGLPSTFTFAVNNDNSVHGFTMFLRQRVADIQQTPFLIDGTVTTAGVLGPPPGFNLGSLGTAGAFPGLVMFDNEGVTTFTPGTFAGTIAAGATSGTWQTGPGVLVTGTFTGSLF